MRYTRIRYTPHEVYAYWVHACEVQAREVYIYEV
jgi:hypothetical protein